MDFLEGVAIAVTSGPQKMAPKVGFVSLGCPKALVDSERMRQRFFPRFRLMADIEVNGSGDYQHPEGDAAILLGLSGMILQKINAVPYLLLELVVLYYFFKLSIHCKLQNNVST